MSNAILEAMASGLPVVARPSAATRSWSSTVAAGCSATLATPRP